MSVEMKKIAFVITHILCVGVGFGLGLYTLPILIQPDSPSMSAVQSVTNHALYTTTFQKDRKDSDFLHWGEGSVSIDSEYLAFVGKLAPGPDYKLYFSPTFIETENDFSKHKSKMRKVGDIKSFDRFTIKLPEDMRLEDYNTVIVWCETFGEFITSARYK